MTVFSNTVDSVVDVRAPRERVWGALSDPAVLADLAPLVSRITADGDIWHWQLARINGLGSSISPHFTEQMTLDPSRRIAFTHAPPPGKREWSWAEGAYELGDLNDGTRVTVNLTISLDLALPRVAKPAVHRVMKATMDRAAAQFDRNLHRHVDLI